MIEFFTMGMLSRFFSDWISQDKKAVAEEYELPLPCLESGLHCVSDLRNLCAHYARLYYWRFASMPEFPKALDYKADRTLFSQILMLKYLYPNRQEWARRILPELEALVEEYLPDISLRHIGFPENWQQLLEIN